jgi:glyoxylase-like metal-dependent hydrolase (beta-lactamase superfamily II)
MRTSFHRRHVLSGVFGLMIFGVLALAGLTHETQAAAASALKLYVFDCGKLDIPDITPYGIKREEMATNMMSVPCFLVVHPKGTLMWDVGAVPDSAIPAGGTGTLRQYGTSSKKLETQLSETGYKPSDITYLAFSHFHWDHVGNANLFAKSTWLARAKEREIMFADPPSPRTEPANFSALKSSKTVTIEGDYDVFGDGTVVMKSAPGHSPDHQVLFVKLANTGPVVLSGDLYHYPEERALKRVPATEFDPQQTAASRARIEAFLKEAHAQLWIQHDFYGTAKLKKSPDFYD